MDQKALSHLDPKARETYDRVMNTAMTTENPVQNTPAPEIQQNFQVEPPPAVSAPVEAPTPLPSAPSDLTMVDTQPASPLAAAPSPVAPSIFSASPVPVQAQSQSSDFFTNPMPGSPESSSAQPSPFAPLSPEQPADTAMATDTLSPLTPVTPYTPAGQEMPSLTPQAVPGAQPLQSPAAALQTPHETSALLKVLYIIGAVVFFAIYTIFWIKVFKLPFLF